MKSLNVSPVGQYFVAEKNIYTPKNHAEDFKISKQANFKRYK